MEGAGLARDAAYLVRPDGPVAIADPAQEPGLFARTLDQIGLRLAA